MRNLLIIFAVLIASSLQGQRLSNQAEISILTYDPVNTIHTVFGHSSFRVVDPERRLDIVFNYGMFDYAAPNFMLNFIKGKLNYELGVQEYRQVLAYSDYRNQSLYEQVLNLDSLQKQGVYDFLINNYKPENRGYLYDFFYDNCATRARDIMDTTFAEALVYDKAKVEQNGTFRDLLQEFTSIRPWLAFGIDLVVGLPTDKSATFEHQMFLPKYVNESFAVATIKTADTIKPLVKITQPVHIADDVEVTSSFLTPIVVFWCLFGLTLLLNIGIKNQRLANIWNGEFIFVSGLVGVIIALMWFGTEHLPTKNNLNILWGFPVNIIAAFWIWRKRPKAMYFKVITVINILLLLTFPIFPQEFALSVIPILLTLIIIGLKYSNIDKINRFFEK